MRLKDLLEKRSRLVERMRSLTEQDSMSDDQAAEFDGLKTEVEGIDRQIDRLRSMDNMQRADGEPATRASRPSGAPAVLQHGRGDNEGNAWRAYLRDGDRSGLSHLLQPGEERGQRPQIVLSVPSQRETRALLEQRAVDSTMNITTAADGGNLVPTTLVGQIALRKNERMLAERLGCQRVPGVGTTVEYPVEKADPDDMPTTAEQSDAHGNNYERSAFQTDKKQFTLVKKTRKLELTEEMLEDTGVDLMGYIADKIAREMGRTHNGMLVAEVEANGTSFKTFASNAAVGAGELEDILGNDTLGFYLEDATDVHWVMRSSTHWKINAIVGDSRMYGATMTGLLGNDVMYSNKVDAIGAGGKSVLLGDWNYMGYRESPDIRFIQDPYTVDGMVILKYSFRAVYGLLQAGAIGYGVHP